ncbi:hypothetical protein B0H15DRAFT_802548 [Mycena belliarum]|uniref:Proteophosphoglycan ppg4 n=1 Tax=Mycena belliarum TaxID=1033014 RepID=A0AAD6XNP8_9AGAR|nr:hypothetical protein B0H15DRAFT_802548 [Mycena belliae]
MSRQPTTDSPNNSSAAAVESLLEQLQAENSEEPSSGSPHRRMSKDSEGYPSWLPKRPLHPAPASTFQSSVHEAGPSEGPTFVGGRKPTPRSVRIVSLQDAPYAEKDRREPTDQTRVGIPPPRVWSRGMGTPLSATVFSSAEDPPPRAPQPKFKATGLHLELLQHPALKFRLYFYLFPLLVFAHIPLQTFFDFNAVYMLIQISKFPNPEAAGVAGSGRNWALAAAAYVACWLVWIFPVFVVYELVYSFARRWRVKRPVMLPLYLSAPAFNLVSMSSYTNFCFMQHLRYSAFVGEDGSVRDGMAETFWFYSQNLPTVALLLPRAGLCLALLLGFSTPDPGVVALAGAGISHRDKTFFRAADGTLTDYARGLLLANAAWTAWRALVVLCSWIGLWALSGAGCAGLCGPRTRWEEEAAEKTMSMYSDNVSDIETLPWSWRAATALRVQTAYEFCLTTRPASRQHRAKEPTDTSELLGGQRTPEPFDGMDRVLAAVGFPSVPTPARRGVLSGALFEPEPPTEFRDVIPKVVKRSSREREPGPSSPLMALPYPFTAPGAHVSSRDRVPFPPSPSPGHTDKDTSGSLDVGEDDDEDDEDDDVDLDDDDLEEEDEEEEGTNAVGSEEPSSGRASGSMSSLGHPVTSRYPFQFRRPARGASGSSGAGSHLGSSGPSRTTRTTRSTQSGATAATQSTGNRESSDSHSPRSQATESSLGARHHSAGANAGAIPMPPRHPHSEQGRGRTRAGTVPAPSGSSSSSSGSPSLASAAPVDFPRRARTSARSRMDSGVTDAFGAPAPIPSVEHADEQQTVGEQDVAESESSHDAAEREDRLGLLSLSPSAAPSPKSSFGALRHRASTLSGQGRRGHSGSHSRTNSHSGSSSSRSRAGSISVSVRSRAQSLLQGIGAASQSSLELMQSAVRMRANSSMARLEEDSSERGAQMHSRSGSGTESDALPSSGGENNTFGHPLRTRWHDAPDVPQEAEEAASSGESVSAAGSAPASPASSQGGSPARLQPSQSMSSVFTAPSTQQPSERTVSRPPSAERPAEPAGIPIIRGGDAQQQGTNSGSSSSSYPDISTAPQSFVTAPATIEGSTTESSGGTISSWGGTSHMVDRSSGAGTWRHPGPA